MMKLTDPLPQASLTPQHGVCIPQKKYAKGAGRDLPTNQNVVLFIRQDGSYIPVPAAVEGDYAGLINRDITALDETVVGFTITLRFEVNRPSHPHCHTSTHRLHSGQGIRPLISR